MNFTHRWLTKKLAVAGQLYVEDLAQVAQSGVKTIICNRPDFEGGPSQPSQSQIQEAATKLGLQFAYLPVLPFGGTDAEAQEMGRLMSTLPSPILAYCAFGGRCIGLISKAAQLGQPIPE